MKTDAELLGRFLVFVMLAILTAATLGASVRVFLIVSGLGG